ncbi:hypothetical protein CYMTET_48267 [Cymbomonas tetramitiformis]|uniref:Nudix hydrolase domain-containing protein n=1 Tax=Cymbomonas tetramitiformis TaxID=36881 RepID=A0AAE0EWX1_9CHLO|nr:hypothetical protein CYMTET_48267 [Cymbomonas tetramitiformis]
MLRHVAKTICQSPRQIGICSASRCPVVARRRPALNLPSRLTNTSPAATNASNSSDTPGTRYPSKPRVGVGVVVLRKAAVGEDPEVLLIKRGKEPNLGEWCFPGGSQELGETLAECAAREMSGCGVKAPLKATGGLTLPLLPVPFTAVDCLDRDIAGDLRFHYTIVEMVATPVDPYAEVTPQGDADCAQWVKVKDLRRFSPVVRHCARIAEEAVQRFTTGRR